MNAPHVEGNFTDESSQAIKPRLVEHYNTYYVHEVCGQVRRNGQQLWNRSQNMKVGQETVSSPNTSYGGKITHKHPCEVHVRELIY
jgi:hypothetical protein